MNFKCPSCGAEFSMDKASLESSSGVITCPSCSHTWLHEEFSLDVDATLGGGAQPPADSGEAPSALPSGDFADFFEITDGPQNGGGTGQKKEQPAPSAAPTVSQPVPEPPVKQQVPENFVSENTAPGVPESALKSQEKSSSGFEEFSPPSSSDEVVPKGEPAPSVPPAAPAAPAAPSGAEEIGDTSYVVKEPQQEEIEKPDTDGGVDEIFGDILDEEKDSSMGQVGERGEKSYAIPGAAQPKPAPAPASAPAQPQPAAEQPAAQAGSGDSELEELFSEEEDKDGREDVVFDEELGEAGMDFLGRGKKSSKKVLLIGIPAVLFLVVVVAGALAWFLPDGLFGFQLKEYLTSDYRRPPKEVLRKLSAKFSEGEKLLDSIAYVDLVGAKKIFKDILATDPRFKGAHAFLAEAEIRLADEPLSKEIKKKISDYLLQAQQWSAGDPEISYVAAELSFKSNDLKGAKEKVKAFLESTGGSAKGFWLLGRIFERDGNRAQAVAQFDRALTVKSGYAPALFEKAVVLARDGDAAAALAALDAIKPAPVEVNLAKATIYAELSKDTAKAKAELSSVVPDKVGLLRPADQGHAYSLLSMIYLSEGDTAKAAEALETALQKTPLNHAYLYRLGMIYEKMGDHEKAASRFAEAVKLDKSNPRYAVALCRSLRAAGKYEDAVKAADAALAVHKDNEDLMVEAGLARIAVGKTKEAEEFFKKVLAKNPLRYEALVGYGDLYHRRGKDLKAAKYYKKAKKIDPSRPEAYLGLGAVYLSLKKPGRAMREFEKARLLDPENVDVMARIGEALILEGKLDKAAGFFERVVKKEPKNLQAIKQLAKIRMKQKLYRQAVENLKKAVEIDNGDIETYLLLAENYVYLNKPEDALRSLNSVKTIDEKNYLAYYWEGIVYRNMGDSDNAYTNFNRAAGLNPHFAEAYFEMGKLLLKEEQLAEAERLLKKAVEVNPKFTEAYSVLADFYLKRNDFENALSVLNKLSELSPKDGSVYLRIGHVYRSTGDLGKANKNYIKAIKYASDRKTKSEGYIGLGQVFEEQGVINKAIKSYKLAVKMNRKDPRPHYYLGYIFKSLNRPDLARKAFTAYLRLAPEGKERSAVREELEYLK